MVKSAEVRLAEFLRSKATLLLLSMLVPALAFSRNPQDELQSFVGQPFMLARVAREGKIKLKRSLLGRISGSCDVAAYVKAASWRSGTAELRLQYVGYAVLVNGRSHGCSTGDEGVLEVTGFTADEPSDSLAADIHRVLQTPEQFLAERGIPFNLMPAPDSVEAVRLTTAIKPPVTLLRVDGFYTPGARNHRVSGSVVVSVVIGADGRIHQAKLVHALPYGLDENALKVLPFWRFQPALRGDNPVVIMSMIQMSFQLL